MRRSAVSGTDCAEVPLTADGEPRVAASLLALPESMRIWCRSDRTCRTTAGSHS